MKLIGEHRFRVKDTLDFHIGSMKTLRADLVERARYHLEIPVEARDIWTAEITMGVENCSPYESEFVVALYYDLSELS